MFNTKLKEMIQDVMEGKAAKDALNEVSDELKQKKLFKAALFRQSSSDYIKKVTEIESYGNKVNWEFNPAAGRQMIQMIERAEQIVEFLQKILSSSTARLATMKNEVQSDMKG